jgi:ribonuclease P protein component
VQTSNKFNKNQKLKSRKLIEQVFSDGVAFSHFPFKVLFVYKDNLSTPVQMGVTVSRRFFKRAVDRNRIKRLIRDGWRLQKQMLEQILLEQNKQLAVFFIYVGNELPPYNLIYEKMSAAINRLIKKTIELAETNI